MPLENKKWYSFFRLQLHYFWHLFEPGFKFFTLYRSIVWIHVFFHYFIFEKDFIECYGKSPWGVFWWLGFIPFGWGDLSCSFGALGRPSSAFSLCLWSMLGSSYGCRLDADAGSTRMWRFCAATCHSTMSSGWQSTDWLSYQTPGGAGFVFGGNHDSLGGTPSRGWAGIVDLLVRFWILANFM